MNPAGEIIVGLDIGTTKICAVVGEVTASGKVDVVGMGSHPSDGLRKGVVVNIETTVSEHQKGGGGGRAHGGLRDHQRDHRHRGRTYQGFQLPRRPGHQGPRGHPPRRGAGAGRKPGRLPFPPTARWCTSCPRSSSLDGQDGIQDPVGMSGMRLEAKVHIVTGAVASAHSLIKCCNHGRAGRG
jgi:cell division protein FtsA